MIACPECGAEMEHQSCESTEPHGEVHRQEWWECVNPDCRAQFDADELDRIFADGIER